MEKRFLKWSTPSEYPSVGSTEEEDTSIPLEELGKQKSDSSEQPFKESF